MVFLTLLFPAGFPCSSGPDSNTSLCGVRYLQVAWGPQNLVVSFLKCKIRTLKHCSMRWAGKTSFSVLPDPSPCVINSQRVLNAQDNLALPCAGT